MFPIRKSWRQPKGFEPFTEWDIKNKQKSKRLFDEDDSWVETEFGYTIDLGWYSNGRNLIGRIIKLGDWSNEIEKKQLSTYDEAKEWVTLWIKKIEEIEDSMTDKEKKIHLKKLRGLFS
jgi:hypothetical protein